MFQRLRRFIDELTGSEPVERDFGENELRVAAAALLVHVAEIDGFFTDSEKRALLLLLQQRSIWTSSSPKACSPRRASATANPSTFMASPRS